MIKRLTATGRRPDGAAFIVAAGLAAGGALLIWQAGMIPDKGGYAGVGSAETMIFVGWGLVLLALAHVVKGLRGATGSVPRQAPVPIAFVVGGLLLQLFLLHPAGFSIAGGVLFSMTAAAFGKRNFPLTLPIGVVFSLLVYAVFDQLLKLNLPTGFLETLIFGG